MEFIITIQEPEIQLITVASQGEQGIAGLIWIDAGWASGVDYVINNALENNGSSYRVFVAHTSSADTEPGVGVDWATVWKVVAEKGDAGTTVHNNTTGKQGGGSGEFYHSTSDQNAAAANANAPSGINPFATVDDIPSIPEHNELTGLQGGSLTERYHLLLSELNDLKYLIGQFVRFVIDLLTATSTRNSPTTVWQKSASIGLSLFVVDPMLPSIGAAANAIVSCWGDSFTEGQGVTPTYPSQVETLSGYTVFNGGVGGETSSQILTRFLASNVEFKNSTVFWMGRNNYSDGVQVKADIASAISGMNDSSINYLVAEILPGDFADEYLGGVNRPVIDQLNADLEVLYGDRFVRILPSLLEAYDPEDAQDVIDVGNGITPSTLRIDDLHLTSAGYGIVANLINTKMSSIFTGLNQANSLIIESAAINLCTCVKANPTDTTNIIKAGDAAGVLSVVDDSVNLALAGLDGVCSSGKVYKLDNSLGVGSAFAIISGITALTNSMSIYARFTTVNGNAFLTNDDLADAVLLSEGGYIRTKRENKAISGPDDRLTIRANQGAIVYFILPQLEESPITSSIIIGADTAASATRDAEVIHVATPTFVQQDGNWAFKFKGTPAATAQALKALFSFDSDATNYTEIQLNAANITANSVLGGVSNGAAVGLYSHTADVQFETNVYYVASTKTLGIRSDDVSGDISAVEFVEDILTSHPVITAVLSTGNRNSANQAICNLDNDGVPVFFASKENAGW